ncbi:GNAT family N-acetyltransferase [Microbacterium luticocti]|uniref:GNAT family N-acetyltransferase n=1 Tax=Microbacterium luticocti TaxID=451764 RepID=UPI000418BDCF|nr:GNAT family N-acetyltransferase [Microbacterium luticocti]
MAESIVRRDDENHRYTLSVDGELAGFTEIRRDDAGRLVMPHTVIIPSFRGRGLAGVLVDGALADAAARGETVVPVCPVVQKQAQKHLRDHEIDGLIVEWPAGGGGV